MINTQRINFGRNGWIIICSLKHLNIFDFFKKKGESTCPKEHTECDETEDATGFATNSKRKRKGPLIEDLEIGEYPNRFDD